MKNCVFCQIVKGQVPAEFVYQDQDLVAFKDIEPKAPVHVLIVPKKHLAKVQEASADDIYLLGKMIYCAKKIAPKLSLKDFKLVINCGPKAGQIVPHLHLHLLGGERGGRCL